MGLTFPRSKVESKSLQYVFGSCRSCHFHRSLVIKDGWPRMCRHCMRGHVAKVQPDCWQCYLCESWWFPDEYDRFIQHLRQCHRVTRPARLAEHLSQRSE